MRALVWFGMSHEICKNVTECSESSQLTTSCVCDHRVTVLREAVSVSEAECVLLLAENRSSVVGSDTERADCILPVYVRNYSSIQTAI